jgi:hypothetical protein
VNVIDELQMGWKEAEVDRPTIPAVMCKNFDYRGKLHTTTAGLEYDVGVLVTEPHRVFFCRLAAR